MVTNTTTQLATGTWTINPNRTDIKFWNKKMMVWTVRGIFELKEGTFEVADPIGDSTVRVVIDAASFKTPTSMRDNHVMKVLDVTTYPDIVFESKEIREVPTGWEVDGNLKIKAEMHPLTLQVTPLSGTSADHLRFEFATIISKKRFGVGVMAPMVADDLHLDVSGEAMLTSPR